MEENEMHEMPQDSIIGADSALTPEERQLILGLLEHTLAEARQQAESWEWALSAPSTTPRKLAVEAAAYVTELERIVAKVR